VAVKAGLDYLVRKGLRRGLFGGETLWLVLGGGALALQLAIKVMRKKEDVVFTEKLAVGDSIVITHRAPTGHKRRREGPAPQP